MCISLLHSKLSHCRELKTWTSIDSSVDFSVRLFPCRLLATHRISMANLGLSQLVSLSTAQDAPEFKTFSLCLSRKIYEYRLKDYFKFPTRPNACNFSKVDAERHLEFTRCENSTKTLITKLFFIPRPSLRMFTGKTFRLEHIEINSSY